jgi:hypothetical protein
MPEHVDEVELLPVQQSDARSQVKAAETGLPKAPRLQPDALDDLHARVDPSA